jgi:hypothetical protein
MRELQGALTMLRRQVACPGCLGVVNNAACARCHGRGYLIIEEKEVPHMAVTSRNPEPDDEDRRPRGPALFSRKKLARQQTTTERLIAFALLAVSWIGVLIFGGGGIDNWLARTPVWAGFAAALVIQAICTRVQWVYAADRWRSPWLMGVLQSAQMPAPTAPYFAGAVLIFAAGLLDYLPEQILTD